MLVLVVSTFFSSRDWTREWVTFAFPDHGFGCTPRSASHGVCLDPWPYCVYSVLSSFTMSKPRPSSAESSTTKLTEKADTEFNADAKRRRRTSTHGHPRTDPSGGISSVASSILRVRREKKKDLKMRLSARDVPCRRRASRAYFHQSLPYFICGQITTETVTTVLTI